MKLHQLLFLVFTFFFSFKGITQIKAFDKLEMLYDQGHYAIVLKKSKRLLDNPQYDFSLVPSLYKSMSLFQLSQNEFWYKRHPNSLDEAKELLEKVKSSSDGIRVFEAHIYEISELRRDLISWSEDLKRTGQRQAFENVQNLMADLFINVPDIASEGEINVTEISDESSDLLESKSKQKMRSKAIAFAKKQIGVPYLWAGNDPSGFDCSGFSSYVMKEIGKEIPRRAKDQYEASVKLKQKVVQKGDLIFFDNGGGISHVGIIVSEKGEALKMIHASSSKGIIITEVENSSYWQKRISGFGTFISD